LTDAGEASPVAPFGDRLAAAVARRESQVVLGIDPDPERLWPDAAGMRSAPDSRLVAALAAAEAAAGLRRPHPEPPRRLGLAAAVLAHCRALIDAAAPACVAAKPQLACFERLGFAGWLALEAVVAHARAHDLLVIADAKRGDFPGTARVYAEAAFGAGLGADAVTQNPLLGEDALAPFVAGARASGAGVFVLVRTSNPGAADFFDLELAAGAPLWERLAALVTEAGDPGPESGLADVGAVCGATAPEHLERMRGLMPHAPFLLPGIGAQGGSVAALAPAFAPGKAAGLVSASRSIADAHAAAGGEPAAAARAEAERLRAAAWALA
jgi:orotidine-5'-phosphate decarboxylase